MSDPQQLSFAFKVYRRTFRVPVRTSWGVWTHRDGVLVRLAREDGRVGFGEIAPLDRFRTETLAGAVAWCASVAGASELARLRDVPRSLPCCAAAVGAALQALAERPVQDGGRTGEEATGSTAGEGTSLACARLLPADASAGDVLARAVDAGFTVFKIKVGTADFDSEHVRVARLIERLPEKGRLRLDANGGLDRRAAARWLDAAADWPVEFVEQPLPPDAHRDLLRLAGDHATMIALDESVRDADDIKRWRDRGWPGLFVIKPALAGDPTELLDEVRIAPADFVFSSALETQMGAAAGVRMAFAAGLTRALGYGVASFFADDGLGGGLERPVIGRADVDAWNLEDVWNRF